MKPTYLKIDSLLILIILLLSLKSFSQANNLMYSLNSTGNNIASNSGFISQSIGQVFFSNMEGDTHLVSEGIQQANHTNIEDAINNEDSDYEPVPIEIDIAIFPNPTTDFVTLYSEGLKLDNLQNSYQLYSYQGRLLNQNIIDNPNTEIDLSNLSSSMYILQVFVQEKLWKTFKILKQ